MSKWQDTVTVATCDECPYQRTSYEAGAVSGYFCIAEPTKDDIDCDPATERPEWCRLRTRSILIKGAEESPKKERRPEMVQGIALCSAECPLFDRYTDVDPKVEAGTCAGMANGFYFARRGTPCRPWVETQRKKVERLEMEREEIVSRAAHAESLNRKLNDRIAALARDNAPPEAKPCLYLTPPDGNPCGHLTVARVDDAAICRAHGGR